MFTPVSSCPTLCWLRFASNGQVEIPCTCMSALAAGHVFSSGNLSPWQGMSFSRWIYLHGWACHFLCESISMAGHLFSSVNLSPWNNLTLDMPLFAYGRWGALYKYLNTIQYNAITSIFSSSENNSAWQNNHLMTICIGFPNDLCTLITKGLRHICSVISR